jgi:hypothetical protein
MRGARSARDDLPVYETVGSIGLPVRALPPPVAALGQPPALPMLKDAARPDPDLAWQSSIGQVIFLESLAQERI